MREDWIGGQRWVVVVDEGGEPHCFLIAGFDLDHHRNRKWFKTCRYEGKALRISVVFSKKLIKNKVLVVAPPAYVGVWSMV